MLTNVPAYLRPDVRAQCVPVTGGHQLAQIARDVLHALLLRVCVPATRARRPRHVKVLALRALDRLGLLLVLRLLLLALAILGIGYVFAIAIRFALSRKREYLADAGAVELTKNPDAMISALQKISGNAAVQAPSEVVAALG